MKLFHLHQLSEKKIQQKLIKTAENVSAGTRYIIHIIHGLEVTHENYNDYPAYRDISAQICHVFGISNQNKFLHRGIYQHKSFGVFR